MKNTKTLMVNTSTGLKITGLTTGHGSIFAEKSYLRGAIVYQGWKNSVAAEKGDLWGNRWERPFSLESSSQIFQLVYDAQAGRASKRESAGWNEDVLSDFREEFRTASYPVASRQNMLSDLEVTAFNMPTTFCVPGAAVGFEECGELFDIYDAVSMTLKVAPSSALEKISEEVLEFCQKEAILNDFFQYLLYVRNYFVNITSVDVNLQSDPEADNSFDVVFEVLLKTEIVNILSMQDRFYAAVVPRIPVKSLSFFTLKCEKDDS